MSSIISFVIGTVEFVYLHEDSLNPYKFTVCSETPFTDNRVPTSSCSSLPLKYLTLSKNGIIRHVDTESESYTFEDFNIEQKLYQRLLGIPIFKRFRQWYVLDIIVISYR